MPINRRLFNIGGLALATAASRGARAAVPADFTLRFGHGYPSTHPLNVRATEAAARIEQDTKGRVVIQLFPNSQLGGDSDLLSQLRSGALDMFSTGGLILSTLVKVASLNGMGFAFADYEKVWPAMDGEVGAIIRDGFAKAGLHAFNIWDNGFRQVSNSKQPITGPADFRGMKIRVPVSPIYVSMFKGLGAAPTSINLGETYSALQTHIVDGQENPLIVIETTKFYEVQKFISMTNHIWDGSWVLVNGSVWKAIPADLQAIVTRHIDASGLDERADIARTNATLRDSLAQRGLAVNTVEPEPFRQQLRSAGFYEEWKTRYDPTAWAALERYVGKLA